MTENTQPTTRYRIRTTNFVNIGGEEFIKAISGGFVWSDRYREQVPRPIMVAYAVEDALHALENGQPVDVGECLRVAEEVGYMICKISKFRDGMGFGTDAGLGHISLGLQLALTRDKDDREEAIKSLQGALRAALMLVEPDQSERNYTFSWIK